ncbi:transmembrane protein 18-like [Teleopsis dalmanni]|uniref:transmembrane protein 18-like n=1 Tax=Teleopsis dalmanni TaxID=139649 RepID=UPI0018CD773B|nr:transmembrane protein 18-like [Teleopsis dalmanni]XP_037954352.1 transmembrane protein 18-like [Teleopsis dalmanni]
MVNPQLIEVNEITGYWTFLMSIDWKDPWLIGLILLHILTTTVAIRTRNNVNFQIFLFLVLLSAAYFSETINEYAAQNWRLFSKQQYFDSNGLFISTVFSIPILLNCMLLIGAWLYNSTQMMSNLKTAQLKQKLRREGLRRTNSAHLKNE